MKSFMMTALAAAASAAMVVACGGGGGDSAEVQTTPTEQQAKLLAARTIHAVFAVDGVAFEVANSSFAPATGGAVEFGHHDLICAQGSGTVTLHDSDGSANLNVGDVGLLVLSACQPHADSRWALDGTPVVTLLATALPTARAVAANAGTGADPGVGADAGADVGADVGADASAGAGVDAGVGGGAVGPSVLTTRVTAQDLSFGAHSPSGAPVMFAGQWNSTADTLSVPARSQVSFLDATLALGNVVVRFDGVGFVADGSISALQGQVSTQVDGLGDVTAQLSLGSALSLDTGKGWYAPTSGVVKVSTATLVMEVEYGAGGAVTLRVDQGSDGRVDLSVQTSQAELDTLLTAAISAPIAGPNCAAMAGPDDLSAACIAADGKRPPLPTSGPVLPVVAARSSGLPWRVLASTAHPAKAQARSVR